MSSKKKILACVLALYTVLGVIAVFIFWKDGSYIMSQKDKTVHYTYEGEQKPVELEEASPALPEPEPVAEEETEVEEPEEVELEEIEPEYYAYEVATEVDRLNVRSEADEKAHVITHFKKGSKGYVLQKGSEWSLVSDGKTTGYVSNEYIKMTPVDEADYPEEYK